MRAQQRLLELVSSFLLDADAVRDPSDPAGLHVPAMQRVVDDLLEAPIEETFLLLHAMTATATHLVTLVAREQGETALEFWQRVGPGLFGGD